VTAAGAKTPDATPEPGSRGRRSTRERLRRLVPALFFALCPPAFAEAFEAVLLVASGEPAVGWRVSVVGTSRSVPVGAGGRFVLDPPPPIPFRIVAAGPHGELSAPIEVARIAPEPLEIRLPTVVRDSVTVVSGVAPGLDLLAAGAATVVSAEALEQLAPQRLVDALGTVAGASQLGEGADSVPALRGLGRGRTLILVDGARVSAERRAGPSATFVDPAALQSVELVRGPGSVVYGSDAFGGVLDAVTRDPSTERSLDLTLEAAEGGTKQLAGSIAGATPIGRGGLRLGLHAVDVDGDEGGGGEEIFNSGFGQKGALVTWLRPTGSGQLRASLLVDRVDDLGKAATDSRAIRAFYPREDSDRLTLSWLGVPGGAWDSLEATLFYGRYRIVLDRDRAPTATSNRRIDRSDTDARDASARAVAGRPLGGGRWLVGVDLHSRFGLSAEVGRVDFADDATTVAGETTTTAIEDARQVTGALFTTWTRPLAERWTLDLGARGDRISSRNRGGWFGDRSETATALSGNVAMTWSASSGWSATAQLARGFRVPTLSDRYFRGPSGRGFVTGNPELDPESSLQLDLAVRRSSKRTALALYGYRYEIEDLVERYRVGEDFRFRNRGTARFVGLEAELQTRLDERWSLEGGAAWTRGRADGGAALDDQPAPRLFAGGRFADRWGHLFARLDLHGRKRDPGPTEVERGSFGRVDFGGSWRISEAFELRAAVRNAFDRRYSGSPDESADLSPGRTLSIALSWEL